jgi:5-oxoprolinase (ATP-hydrolysing) subunit A
MLRIDVNADVGESLGAWPMGHDARLMPFVSSANIACGFHAGDPDTMRRTVELALEHHVAIGAHPGLQDLVGFGRREMHVSAREVENLVTYQIGALWAIAAARGGTVRHVKAHGALYNMAARDSTLADAIARGVAAVDRSLILFGLAGSELIDAGRRAGLRTASEVFGDRAYLPDGRLQPRGEPGAVIHDADVVASRVIEMVKSGQTTAVDGSTIAVRAETVCVHGDTPDAAELARRVRAAIAAAGVVVAAPE